MSTDFVHYDLGYRNSGDTVEVALVKTTAFVRLLNDSEFNNYKAKKSYRFIGGLPKESPVILQIPNYGHWHVVLDQNGDPCHIESKIKIRENN